MKAGRLEVYAGSMFAEKSTNLIRQAKRHLMAGRSVVMLKPEIDGRYGFEAVVTHDGRKMEAVTVAIDDFTNTVDSFHKFQVVEEADVICIDEIQFFPQDVIPKIEYLVATGSIIYVAGLDMDKDGNPFETTMYLMARAEEVHKVKAVCQDCGEDGWTSVETKKQYGRVNIGNDYKPLCRSCSLDYRSGGLTH